MDFRCANCLTSNWIDRVEPLGRSDTVLCPSCGTTHEANPVPLLGSTLGSHYRRTVDFANEMGIDMPSAYSVLLQFMTLNDVRSAGDRAKTDASEPVQAPDESTRDAVFPELTDEELNLLERLAANEDAGTPSGPKPDDGTDAALFSALSSDELDLLERFEADGGKSLASTSDRARTEEGQNTLFPGLSDIELGLLDGIFLKEESESAAKPETGAARTPLLLEFDPGFAKAVKKGRLTVQEALRRGNRSEYAHEMARRNRLPMRLAYAVADNRVTLRKATLYHDAARMLRRPTPPPVRGGVSWCSAALVLGIATTTVCLATWGLWSRNFEPARLEISRAGSRAPTEQSVATSDLTAATERTTREQALRSATAVLTDELGRVTQITGPDPGHVLRAFCENAAEHDFLEPKEVTETVPPAREARLGVFRDLQSLTVSRAIRIRRDRQSRRWVAGDGEHPVQVMEQPVLPPGAFRMVVAAR